MKAGLILFAHGARDPRWAAPFEAVAAQVRAQRPDVQVRLAFLEFMTPSLPDAGAELAALGRRGVMNSRKARRTGISGRCARTCAATASKGAAQRGSRAP